jgi:hypothetical protein
MTLRAVLLGLIVGLVLAVDNCGVRAQARDLLWCWLNYLYRTLPRVEVSPPGIVTGLVAMALAIASLHLVASTQYARFTSGTNSAACWRLRWTMTIIAAVIPLFVAGLAFVGLFRSLQAGLGSAQPTTLLVR